MLIVTHDTLRNPSILEVRQLPRKFVERVTVWPRPMPLGTLLRIVAEFQWLRYALWLLPLVLIAGAWRETALPLSQAPILMVVLIVVVEMRVLRVSPARRASLIDADAAERGLDHLRVQARAALTRIAAGRGQRTGELRLVVEQSPLSWLPPLTYVSVQSDHGPCVVALSPEERDILHETLFQEPLTERLLHRISASRDTFLHEIPLKARAVSAHARLAAALA